MKKAIFLFLIILNINIYPKAISIINNRSLNVNDFLLVIISHDDLLDAGIYSKDEDSLRYQIRLLHTKFIMLAKNIAKYMILDTWYPDKGIKKIDKLLLKELKSVDNISFGWGGLENGKNVQTEIDFLDTIKEPCHFIFRYLNENELTFNRIEYFDISDGKHVKKLPFKHISFVLFNYLKIPYEEKDVYKINTSEIIEFKKISLFDFELNTELARNKIVILGARYISDDNMDIHLIKNKGLITGTELLSNFILKAQTKK